MKVIERREQYGNTRPLSYLGMTWYGNPTHTHIAYDADGEIKTYEGEPVRVGSDLSGFFMPKEYRNFIYVGKIEPENEYDWIISVEEIKWGSAR